MSTTQRGLSLIEVVIAITMIVVLMALSLPMMTNANARARSELCQQNLVEIGQCVASYSHDHGTLPALDTAEPMEPGQSLPEFLEPRLQTPQVMFCPSDETAESQALGTSYRWNRAFDGLPTDQLDGMLGLPLLADREDFHQGSDPAINELVLSDDDVTYRMSLAGNNHDTNAKTRATLRLCDKPNRPTQQTDTRRRKVRHNTTGD